MRIEAKSFGGRLGWVARKTAPRLCSLVFSKLNFALRRNKSKKFIHNFLSSPQVPQPLSVAIETINRCNGVCNFCPCNVKDEKRPIKKMTTELFESIVLQLADWDYKGRIVMNINNEPLLDDRIVEFCRHIKEKLPCNHVYIITNGTLLTIERLKQIAAYVDRININNYSKKMRLHENLGEIVAHINANAQEYTHLDIDIQYRYIGEVLSNRNGASPNKLKTEREIDEPCLEPFTAMYIYPDGVAGLCCFDALEKTNMGNCSERSVKEIWQSEKYKAVREAMSSSRSGYDFCKHCDGFAKVSRDELYSVARE